jgi:nanoRNase/pAp phosphatase (c-di-AMP/oligoRNAs hydrolase)
MQGGRVGHAVQEKTGKLLIVVSDREGLSGGARAGGRSVRCWDSSSATAFEAEHTFGGDPAQEDTFGWAKGAQAVSAVIDLADDRRASAVLDAIRSARPDAAVLVLADGIRHPRGDGTLARSGDLRDVVRLDLDEELDRLEAERRVHCLREFVAGADVVPVVIHPDPDPDAISSAFALRTILRRKAESLPIVTLRHVTRSENRRMIELLRMTVTEVSVQELQAFDRLITVDSQPTMLKGRAKILESSRLAVIDHHPPESGYHAEFLDVRPLYGATATMMTEYLRTDAGMKIGSPLATALLYGIKTDTGGLIRGVSAADVEAYAYLQEHADPSLLRRLERPSYPIASARAYGTALAGLQRDNDTVVAFAGALDPDQMHVLADLGDFCLGIEGVTWAVAAALINDELVMALRHTGPGPGAGDFARYLASSGGRGGGHGTMARVSIPAGGTDEWLGRGESPARRLLEKVMETIAALDD